MTVCTRSTSAASVSLAVGPLTATGVAAARSTALPPTVTVNALAAGTEPSSRPPSKVTVSVVRSTAAEENRGGVLLVIVRFETAAASFPDRSCSRSPAAEGGV